MDDYLFLGLTPSPSSSLIDQYANELISSCEESKRSTETNIANNMPGNAIPTILYLDRNLFTPMVNKLASFEIIKLHTFFGGQNPDDNDHPDLVLPNWDAFHATWNNWDQRQDDPEVCL